MQHWREDRFDRHGVQIKKGSGYHVSFKDQLVKEEFVEVVGNRLLTPPESDHEEDER